MRNPYRWRAILAAVVMMFASLAAPAVQASAPSSVAPSQAAAVKQAVQLAALLSPAAVPAGTRTWMCWNWNGNNGSRHMFYITYAVMPITNMYVTTIKHVAGLPSQNVSWSAWQGNGKSQNSRGNTTLVFFDYAIMGANATDRLGIYPTPIRTLTCRAAYF